MRVGFIQNNPVFADIRSNLARVEALLTHERADLMVLPELFSTGYLFLNRKEALALGEPIPEGSTTQFLIRAAKQHQTTIVAGIAERNEEKTYNSAVVIGPGGYLGKYRKTHLFDTEKNYFDPGDLPLNVFEIGSVRIGIMICFDWRFPETARTLALAGADLIAHPSNLVLPHCPQAMITRCLENRVFAITANRTGVEERVHEHPLHFIGQSQVVDPDGNVLYRASENDEEVRVVEININRARDKSINSKNDLFEDRRHDLYSL